MISNRLSTERWTWTAHRESREQTGCSYPSTERPNGDQNAKASFEHFRCASHCRFDDSNGNGSPA
jgi:hypothetical protein